MNKKIFSYMIPAAMAVAGLSGCSEEQTLAVGEGTMFISTRVNSDVKVESRAETADELAASLAATTKVWIYSDAGVVRKFNGLSEVPASGLKLIAGNYTVKAWAGTLSYASFEDRWFEGREEVTVEANGNTAVEVVCKIANVVASVSYPEDIANYLSDYSMTISHKGGSLTFEGNNPDQKGYYMMPEGVNTLDYVLTFTTDGQQKSVHGTIADVQPAHHYVLNVVANPDRETTDGAAFIEIVVDESMVEMEDEIVITTPPAITGYGFDINTPVAGEHGTIGRKSVYVAAASAVKKLVLSGMPGQEDVDLIRATDEVLANLRASGIFHEVTNEGEAQLIKIVFDDIYLNKLENSDTPYVIGISATDAGGKTTSTNLTLRITEAPVVTADIPAEAKECYYTQTISATIAKDNVEAAGFEYAIEGTEDWLYVEGHAARAAFVKGQTYTATLTDLALGTKYKYRAVSGTAAEITYRSDVKSFETGVLSQFPNPSFEDWSERDGVIMPTLNPNDEAWDTGNHGAKKAGAVLTQGVTTIKHSGNKAAELVSLKAAIMGIGKFAAGNLFYGKYLDTEGTDGVIGFGRPMTFPTRELKPVAIKLWVKYTPTNDWEGNTDHKPASGYDEGHIFTALFDGPDNRDKTPSYNGQYGSVVRTKAKYNQLFDKNAANVIAYGEHIFTEATPGDGLIELTIPYEYYAGKENTVPTHIALTMTASRYGDYFQGGKGSTMYVDDVEIIYGAK